jgi:hypothetical protein
VSYTSGDNSHPSPEVRTEVERRIKRRQKERGALLAVFQARVYENDEELQVSFPEDALLGVETDSSIMSPTRASNSPNGDTATNQNATCHDISPAYWGAPGTPWYRNVWGSSTRRTWRSCRRRVNSAGAAKQIDHPHGHRVRGVIPRVDGVGGRAVGSDR